MLAKSEELTYSFLAKKGVFMTAKLIRFIEPLPPETKGGVLTIGNFDGVHLGHQKLINKVREEASRRHVPSVVVTFEPHPFEFFSKEKVTVPRLTRMREKFLALSECGVNFVIILKFNQLLASI